MQKAAVDRERRKQQKLLTFENVAREIHLVSPSTLRIRIEMLWGYRENAGAESAVHAINRFKDEGCDVLVVDYPGHGHSGGRRGYISRIRHLAVICYGVLDLLLKLPDLLKEPERKEAPVYLVCYSTGVVAAVLCYFRYRITARHIAGMVFVSSPLNVDQNSSWLGEKLRPCVPYFSLLLGQVRVPRLLMHRSVRHAKNGGMCSFNERAYMGRPFFRYVCEMFEVSTYVQFLVKRIPIPICAIHGTEDRVACFETAQRVFTDMDNVTFVPIEGVGHYVWGESPKVVLDTIVRWIFDQEKKRAKHRKKKWKFF